MKNDTRFAAKFKEMNENAEHEVVNSASTQLFQEFCGPDYKNEIALVRVIKEITDSNNKLSKKIIEYNSHNQHKKKFHAIPPTHPIDFEALTDINSIFKDSDVLLREIHQRKTDFFLSAA